jgi:sec-independent protein translocase protein TatB
MFDIGWSEILVIAVVAIVVIGPKDLPAALRAFGKWTGKMKRMARDFQSQFNEALREAELDDVKKMASDVRREIADATRIDPMADLRKDVAKTQTDIATGLAKPADPELKQLAADTGVDEPAPVAEPKIEPPAAVLPAPEPVVAATAAGDGKA